MGGRIEIDELKRGLNDDGNEWEKGSYICVNLLSILFHY